MSDVQPKREGASQISECSTIRWAVFNRADVEHMLSDDRVEVAEDLTGWYSFYNGAGRSFGENPTVRLSRTRVLVTQYCGVDV